MTAPIPPQRLTHALRELLTAERTVISQRASVVSKQAILTIIAVVCLSLTVLMGNAAAYLWLETLWPPYIAALAVAGGNLALAIVLGLIAKRLSSGDRGLNLAQKHRDAALIVAEHELDVMVEEVRGTAAEVRAFARDPLGRLTTGLLAELVNALLARLTDVATSATAPDRSEDRPENKAAANAPGAGPVVTDPTIPG